MISLNKRVVCDLLRPADSSRKDEAFMLQNLKASLVDVCKEDQSVSVMCAFATWRAALISVRSARGQYFRRESGIRSCGYHLPLAAALASLSTASLPSEPKCPGRHLITISIPPTWFLALLRALLVAITRALDVPTGCPFWTQSWSGAQWGLRQEWVWVRWSHTPCRPWP
jgi:hypothetical protein